MAVWNPIRVEMFQKPEWVHLTNRAVANVVHDEFDSDTDDVEVWENNENVVQYDDSQQEQTPSDEDEDAYQEPYDYDNAHYNDQHHQDYNVTGQDPLDTALSDFGNVKLHNTIDYKEELHNLPPGDYNDYAGLFDDDASLAVEMTPSPLPSKRPAPVVAASSYSNDSNQSAARSYSSTLPLASVKSEEYAESEPYYGSEPNNNEYSDDSQSSVMRYDTPATSVYEVSPGASSQSKSTGSSYTQPIPLEIAAAIGEDVAMPTVDRGLFVPAEAPTRYIKTEPGLPVQTRTPVALPGRNFIQPTTKEMYNAYFVDEEQYNDYVARMHEITRELHGGSRAEIILRRYNMIARQIQDSNTRNDLLPILRAFAEYVHSPPPMVVANSMSNEHKQLILGTKSMAIDTIAAKIKTTPDILRQLIGCIPNFYTVLRGEVISLDTPSYYWKNALSEAAAMTRTIIRPENLQKLTECKSHNERVEQFKLILSNLLLLNNALDTDLREFCRARLDELQQGAPDRQLTAYSLVREAFRRGKYSMIGCMLCFYDYQFSSTDKSAQLIQLFGPPMVVLQNGVQSTACLYDGVVVKQVMFSPRGDPKRSIRMMKNEFDKQLQFNSIIGHNIFTPSIVLASAHLYVTAYENAGVPCERRDTLYVDERGIPLVKSTATLLAIYQAISFLETKHVVNPDLHQGNILYKPVYNKTCVEVHVQLIDFGLAEIMTSTQRIVTTERIGRHNQYYHQVRAHAYMHSSINCPALDIYNRHKTPKRPAMYASVDVMHEIVQHLIYNRCLNLEPGKWFDTSRSLPMFVDWSSANMLRLFGEPVQFDTVINCCRDWQPTSNIDLSTIWLHDNPDPDFIHANNQTSTYSWHHAERAVVESLPNVTEYIKLAKQEVAAFKRIDFAKEPFSSMVGITQPTFTMQLVPFDRLHVEDYLLTKLEHYAQSKQVVHDAVLNYKTVRPTDPKYARLIAVLDRKRRNLMRHEVYANRML